MRLLLVFVELLAVILLGIGLYALINSFTKPDRESKPKKELPEDIDRSDE